VAVLGRPHAQHRAASVAKGYLREERDARRRHLPPPAFFKYLGYFVFGPDLPARTQKRFSALHDECAPITSGDEETFCELAKREARAIGLDRKRAAREFFKLSLELGLDDDMAPGVRDAVMKLRGS